MSSFSRYQRAFPSASQICILICFFSSLSFFITFPFSLFSITFFSTLSHFLFFPFLFVTLSFSLVSIHFSPSLSYSKFFMPYLSLSLHPHIPYPNSALSSPSLRPLISCFCFFPSTVSTSLSSLIPDPLFPHLPLVSLFRIHYFLLSPSTLSSLSIISSSLLRLSVPYPLYPNLSLVSQFLIHYILIFPSSLSSLSIISSSLPRLSVSYPLFSHLSLDSQFLIHFIFSSLPDSQFLIPYCTVSSHLFSSSFFVLLNPARFYWLIFFLLKLSRRLFHHPFISFLLATFSRLFIHIAGFPQFSLVIYSFPLLYPSVPAGWEERSAVARMQRPGARF